MTLMKATRKNCFGDGGVTHKSAQSLVNTERMHKEFFSATGIVIVKRFKDTML